MRPDGGALCDGVSGGDPMLSRKVMQKGLKISLNGCSIGPIPVSFLFSENMDEEGVGRYVFYLFAVKIYGVEVRMAVGFYGKKTMPTQEEFDAELEEPSFTILKD